MGDYYTTDRGPAQDKIYGTSVSIKIKPAAGVTQEEVQNRLRDILTRYTIHYHLSMESESSGRMIENNKCEDG